uniref:AP-3 complex subunit delta n=1 Tax=Heterosigma akashiwo TaxID=2829 RepID=A0A7S3Y2N8_HETAK
MFEKSLQDLVKGIRTHKRDPGPFISQAISEIKQELKSKDDFLKGQAIRKLTYLQMLGYDMSWASFLIVETMSMARFAHKRIGYLAAAQSFTQETDVVLLATNLLKKELLSDQAYNGGLALNCVANIATHDLSRDLLADVTGLLESPKPYLRKKAVTALYKLYVRYPQGLRLTFDKLKEHLDDPDISVVSATVNVVCELAHRNPRNFLAMAPKFFRLLTTTSNNWMLIKVVKLLGALVTEEPRLARKLLEPLATIVQNTGAKSLLYECIYTVTKALPHTRKADGTDARNAPAVVRLCSEQLRLLIEDPDANLKYLGLVALSELMKSHPREAVGHKDNILKCLNDEDVTIRTRALELLTGMVTKRNLEELVHKFLQHVATAEGTYRDTLVEKILFMCARDKYAYLEDFAWYMSVLVDLAHLQGSDKHGAQLAAQIRDVAMRVESVRAYTVEAMLKLVLDPTVILRRSALAGVLAAAAWVVGEYCEEYDELEDPSALAPEGQNLYLAVADALTHPNLTNLAPGVQALYLQNAFKVFVSACGECGDRDLDKLLGMLSIRLRILMQSVHAEVQERAAVFRHLLTALGVLPDPQALEEQEDVAEEEGVPNLLSDMMKSAPRAAAAAGGGAAAVMGGIAAAKSAATLAQLRALVAEPIRAVNPKAQRRVPVPGGLDLDEPFDQGAMDRLLAEEDEAAGRDIHQVFFTHIPIEFSGPDKASEAPDSPGSKRRLGQFTADDLAGSEESDSDDGAATKASSVAGGGGGSGRGEVALGSGGRRGAADEEAGAFYLGGSKKAGDLDVDSIPMVALTVDDLKGKKKKDKKKKDKKKNYSVDTEELMPAGALGGSDDEDDAPAGLPSSSRARRRPGGGGDARRGAALEAGRPGGAGAQAAVRAAVRRLQLPGGVVREPAGPGGGVLRRGGLHGLPGGLPGRRLHAGRDGFGVHHVDPRHRAHLIVPHAALGSDSWDFHYWSLAGGGNLPRGL